MPQFSWLEEIVPKIEQTFGLSINTEEIISFDDNQYLKGIEFITPLFDAILNKKTLHIEYKSFKDTTINSFVISPYYLKQYNNRWYLLGQIENYNTLTVIALDRIINFKEACLSFIENTMYDFNEYFEDIVGVSREKDKLPEIITLFFTSNKAPYIKTKPIHGSQKLKKEDAKGIVITIEVIVNYELKSLLLSFGNEVKVLSPDWLDFELKKMSYS